MRPSPVGQILQAQLAAENCSHREQFPSRPAAPKPQEVIIIRVTGQTRRRFRQAAGGLVAFRRLAAEINRL